MNIVFFRHGHALSVFEADVSSDSERPLSDIGKNSVLKSANKLKEFNFSPEIIISSPFKRAKETASILLNFFDIKNSILMDSLTNPSDIEKTLNEIIKISAGKNTIVVGHQPKLGYMSSIIAKSENLQIAPAGFIVVKINDYIQKAGEIIFSYNN
jgi:phosphohistidine phosphatase